MRPLVCTSVIAMFGHASAAYSDVHAVCTFDSLPSIVMTYPSDVAGKPTMSVDDRPAVEMIVGAGSARFESATVDGYLFRFSPANSFLDVEQDGTVIGSEQGKCVTIGGPVNPKPLTLEIAASQDTPLAAAEDPASDQDLGAWRVRSDVSAFDDSTSVFLRLDAKSPIRTKYGQTGTPSLHLRCLENRTSMFLIVADEFLSDIQGYGRVEYRIDRNKASHWNMKGSTDNKALGLWSGGQSIGEIKKLMAGDTLALRVTPFNESPLQIEFPISGLTQAIKPLRAACNW